MAGINMVFSPVIHGHKQKEDSSVSTSLWVTALEGNIHCFRIDQTLNALTAKVLWDPLI